MMTLQSELTNIKKILLNSQDTKRIPNLNPRQWSKLNKQYDKETIIEALIEHIKEQKPEPPILPITEREMIYNFIRLRSTPSSKFFLTYEETKNRVYEKYDDYGKKYADCGLGVVQMGNGYLDVSNYFNQTLRLNCDTYGFKSVHHRWREAEDLRSVFLALWRLGNDKLDETSIVGAFRLSSYIATQFKPHVAKFIYDSVDAKTVFDSSCGWGDRLAGFYCSEAKEYYGCDPNPETFEMYMNQCLVYEKILGNQDARIVEKTDKHFVLTRGKKRVEIHRCAAEDFDYNILPPIDCAFTSPPYFSTELYNAGGEHEGDQSWKRYSTYEKWRDNFYLPVSEKTFEHISDGGIQIVNIQDPKVHDNRYYASDDLIDALCAKYQNCVFLGQLGMRIMQRPRNIEKEQLLALFDKIYVEPCWVFGKNRTAFMKNGGSLLSFMN